MSVQRAAWNDAMELKVQKPGEEGGSLPGVVPAAQTDVEAANKAPGPDEMGTQSSGAPAVKPDDGDGTEPEQYANVTYFDILKHFSLMGYIGFGGPAAHIGKTKPRPHLTPHRPPPTSQSLLPLTLVPTPP